MVAKIRNEIIKDIHGSIHLLRESGESRRSPIRPGHDQAVQAPLSSSFRLDSSSSSPVPFHDDRVAVHDDAGRKGLGQQVLVPDLFQDPVTPRAGDHGNDRLIRAFRPDRSRPVSPHGEGRADRPPQAQSFFPFRRPSTNPRSARSPLRLLEPRTTSNPNRFRMPRLDLAVAAFAGRDHDPGIPVAVEQQKLPAVPEGIDEVLPVRAERLGDLPVHRSAS